MARPPKGSPPLTKIINGIICKKCTNCKEHLPESAYTPCDWKRAPGEKCRNCRHLARRALFNADPEKYRQRDKERYNRYRHSTWQEGWYRRKYGLTIIEVQKLIDNQKGICLGCHECLELTGGKGRKFHIDHDHKTKCVRGLLCHRCNTALGLLKENQDTMKRLIEYITKQ